MALSSCHFLTLLLVVTTLCSCYAEQSDGKPEPLHIVLFMFFGIGVGVLFVQVLSYLGDPVHYTVCVFIAGILFSLANTDGTGVFGESVSMWIHIDAKLLLFVFLPPLIFGEAMQVNWYQAYGAMAQAMILAGPGVLIGALLTGCIMKGIQPQWTWYLCMTFGSIMSATDPVAVVALLKSVGASPKLTMIVVGESLLNDGVSMVLFAVFFNQLNGTVYSFGEIVLYLLEASIGSCLVGIGIGLIAVRWLRTAKRPLSDTDVLVQTAITFCTAYVTFYVTQSTLGISGVLGCCGSGIMFAWLAPSVILNHDTMHIIWGTMEWMLNTMIFLLAGLIIGNRVFHHVRAQDWGILFALYILIIIIRFFVVGVCFPVISRVGHKCTWQDSVFIAWGGLRGAVSLALALITYRSGPASMEKETSRLLFYVGGIAAITIMVNATTANSLLFSLDMLDSDSVEKDMVMASTQKKLRKHLRKALEEIALEFRFSEREVEEVCQTVSALKELDIQSLMRSVAEQRAEKEHKAPSRRNSDAPRMLLPATQHERPESVANPLHLHQQDSAEPLAPTKRRRSIDNGRGAPLYGTIPEDEEVGENDRPFDVIEMLEAGQNSRPQRSRGSSNATDSMNRRISMSGRGPTANILPQLLAYVRSTFLSMVRVRYWHDIEQGKIPRKSKSGKFLLYSIEVGLDGVHSEAGARDWACVESYLESTPYEIRVLNWFDNFVPEILFTYPGRYLNKLECNREERAVYILTSFIAAHESAQRKIHGYLRVDDGEGDPDQQSPEELKVVAESQLAVTIARRRLENINPETVTALRTKQAAALLLTKQGDVVKDMVQEGLLTQKDAEGVIESINKDMAGIENKRNMMYQEHDESSKRRRKAFRKLDENSSN